jgi:hypothetical protein
MHQIYEANPDFPELEESEMATQKEEKAIRFQPFMNERSSTGKLISRQHNRSQQVESPSSVHPQVN